MSKELLILDKPILFYDGDCGFCQRSVQFIIEHEKSPLYNFAPLQGEAAVNHLPKALTEDLDSLVILSGNTIYTKSDAVLFIANSLVFPYSLAKIGKVIPVRIRNQMYKLVARNRFKLSKVSKTCVIPSDEERLRFIK